MKLIGVYLFIVSSWLLSKSPEFILYRFADFLYVILYYVIGYRKKVVFDNLRNSFPKKSDKEINNIAKKFFRNLSDTFIENIAIITMSKKRIHKLVKIEDGDIAKELYKKNKNIIGITGHYCNWEACLVLPLLSQHQVLGVYKPLNNKLFDKLFYNMRAKFGAIPITMHDTYKTVLEYKKNNKLTFLGLISDQRPHKQAGNYWTTFLNQDTVIFLGPEKFARKLNASVIFIYLEKVKRGKYILKTKLLFEDAANCKDFEITETHLKFLEKMIVEKPEYWLWSHKRWKHKRKNSIVP